MDKENESEHDLHMNMTYFQTHPLLDGDIRKVRNSTLLVLTGPGEPTSTKTAV